MLSSADLDELRMRAPQGLECIGIPWTELETFTGENVAHTVRGNGHVDISFCYSEALLHHRSLRQSALTLPRSFITSRI
jgi:hypothetical protein